MTTTHLSTRWALRAATLGLAVMATAALATKVVETAPGDIAGSLPNEGVTVLLLWSPDPKCGYCVGEDKAFDALAKPYSNEVVFRRVQWTPWTAFPQLGLDVRVDGIPHLYVFRGKQATAYMGRQIRGDAAWVKTQIDMAVTGRNSQLFGNEPLAQGPTVVPKTPPNPAEVESMRLMAHSHILEQGAHRCTDLNMRLGTPLMASLAQWRTRHQVQPLEKAPELVGRVGTAAVAQMVVDADKTMAGQLSLNTPSMAGCTELMDWLKKD